MRAQAENDWRAPTVPDGETVLYDEPGRVLDGHSGNYRVSYEAYHYTLTRAKHGDMTLLVKHGGGEQSYRIGYENAQLLGALSAMDSDQRYIMLHRLRSMYEDGAKHAEAKTRSRYVNAFADGTLKKRKVRGQDQVKVWIEPARLEKVA